MYEYKVVPSIRSEEFQHVVAYETVDGWDVYQVDRYREHEEWWYAVVFKRPSKDISYGQLQLNRFSDKLAEVRNNLRVTCADSAPAKVIADDIDKFLFQSSPEDM